MQVLKRIALLALPVMFVAGCQTPQVEDASSSEGSTIAMEAKATADKALAAVRDLARSAAQAARAAERAAAAAERAANEAKSAGDKADRMFRKNLRK